MIVSIKLPVIGRESNFYYFFRINIPPHSRLTLHFGSSLMGNSTVVDDGVPASSAFEVLP